MQPANGSQLGPLFCPLCQGDSFTFWNAVDAGFFKTSIFMTCFFASGFPRWIEFMLSLDINGSQLNANPWLCAPHFCANVTHTQPDIFQQSSNVWAGFGKYDDKYHLVRFWWCSLPREQAEVWGNGGKEHSLFEAGPLSPAILVLSRERQNSACQGLLPIVCTPERGWEPRLFLP